MDRKNVQIWIRSIQHDIEDTATEHRYQGHYAFQNGEHLLSYEEPLPDSAMIKNLYRISGDRLSLSKSGSIASKMLFSTEKKHQDSYQTPFGSFALMLHTKELSIHSSKEALTVHLNYDLHLDHAFVSNCTIDMRVEF